MNDFELDCVWHEGFQQGPFQLYPYICFTYGERSMLIRRETGTTLFLSAEAAERLSAGQVEEQLRYRLIANGFARVPGVLPIQDNSKVIIPSFFLIDMTNQCNLNCAYCLRVPNDQGKSITEKMVDDICEFIWNHCRLHQLKHITIQPWGGEPLLQLKQIIRIRQWFNQHNDVDVNITVETNGTLLNEKTLTELRHHHIAISVSFDGPTDLHDLQRRDWGGNPTSERVLHGIELARKAGYDDLGGICVLTDHSIGRIADILDYTENVLKMKGVKLNLMHQPSYPCDGVRALSHDEILQIAEEIINSVRVIRSKGSMLHESCTADRLNNLLSKSNANICHSCGCCGGRRMVSFDMDGNIYPCELTDWPDECLGNIAEGRDLCDMVEKAIETHPYFCEKRKPECERCPWWFYCRGGCSSAVKYINQCGNGVDECECSLNLAMYPLLTKLLLENEINMKGWL